MFRFLLGKFEIYSSGWPPYFDPFRDLNEKTGADALFTLNVIIDTLEELEIHPKNKEWNFVDGMALIGSLEYLSNLLLRIKRVCENNRDLLWKFDNDSISGFYYYQYYNLYIGKNDQTPAEPIEDILYDENTRTCRICWKKSTNTGWIDHKSFCQYKM